MEKFYKIIKDENNECAWFVKLTDECGDFSGLYFSYGKVELVPVSENNQSPLLRFERDILHLPDKVKNLDLTQEQVKEFEELLGKILLDIIDKHSGQFKVEDGKIKIEVN